MIRKAICKMFLGFGIILISVASKIDSETAKSLIEIIVTKEKLSSNESS